MLSIRKAEEQRLPYLEGPWMMLICIVGFFAVAVPFYLMPQAFDYMGTTPRFRRFGCGHPAHLEAVKE